IRLVGGSNHSEGRVEVYYEGKWGTVCHYSWDIYDADVVCRQLGFQGAESGYKYSYFGGGTGQIWLGNVRCGGRESSLFFCRNDGWGNHDCTGDHNRDAGVRCSGSRGRQRRCVPSYFLWQNIPHPFDRTNLKRPTPTWTTRAAPTTSFDCLSGEFQCRNGRCVNMSNHTDKSSRTNLPSLSRYNTPLMPSFLRVSKFDVRLVGGSRNEGRVEVYYNGTWGTVCNDGWDINDARVVCSQLGFDDAKHAYTSSYFGQGSGQVWLDNVGCTGRESSLFSCIHGGVGIHDCRHSQDVGVRCRGRRGLRDPCTRDVLLHNGIRLVNGRSRNEGRVEVYYQGRWGTVCDDDWDLNDARVVCRQLGLQDAETAYKKSYFGRGTGQFWLDDVNCTGHEESLISCRHRGMGNHDCSHVENAGVRCSAAQ
ncbi:Deleted in malignant brain tumors 1, partial, partial [Paramuricea clavata]